jgi:N-methylhydantoinase A
MRLIGVDVGGTHTDLLSFDSESGEIAVHKLPSTPNDHSVGLVDGVGELLNGAKLDLLAHGTTVATNTLLQHDGASVGLITTFGFRDILHIGRHQRPLHYSIKQRIPWQDDSLVQRRHRKVVRERIDAQGHVLEELDEDGVVNAARELREAGVEAIVVAFLNSYRNPSHERRAAQIVCGEVPGVFVTTSAGVIPQFREFERFTAAAVNGFVGPKVKHYIDQLGVRLAEAELHSELRIMRSNGGAATSEFAANYPVTLLLSGPAAGVLAGAHVGLTCGRDNLVTFDVGGTSADIGIVVNGVIEEASPRDTWVAGLPIIVPMIDVHTVGAGGGSVGYVDSGDAFRVGPRSAGAVPGPACYGNGGIEPTVTDAHLVLGRFGPGRSLAAKTTLAHEPALAALQRLGDRLHMRPQDAAVGILRLANQHMANAIRTRTVQKGKDPRGFTLVAFGGAGPLHAADVALLLGLREVLIPLFPGITSAMGLLTSDLKYDLLRTVFLRDSQTAARVLNDIFAELRAEASEQLMADDVDKSQMRFDYYIDCRYLGQGYELRVPVTADTLDDTELGQCWSRFHEMHAAEYGHCFEQNEIELINVRLVARGALPRLPAFSVMGGLDITSAQMATERVLFTTIETSAWLPTAFYERSKLGAGAELVGPAIILQMDSTTVVPPGCTAEVLGSGDILIRLGVVK